MRRVSSACFRQRWGQRSVPFTAHRLVRRVGGGVGGGGGRVSIDCSLGDLLHLSVMAAALQAEGFHNLVKNKKKVQNKKYIRRQQLRRLESGEKQGKWWEGKAKAAARENKWKCNSFRCNR